MSADISRLPLPAGAATEQPQLTDSQHTLRRAIASKSHEERLVGGISERLQRLKQIVHEDRVLGSRIRELQLAHQAERALWLENGSDGPEPKPSPPNF